MMFVSDMGVVCISWRNKMSMIVRFVCNHQVYKIFGFASNISQAQWIYSP